MQLPCGLCLVRQECEAGVMAGDLAVRRILDLSWPFDAGFTCSDRRWVHLQRSCWSNPGKLFFLSLIRVLMCAQRECVCGGGGCCRRSCGLRMLSVGQPSAWVPVELSWPAGQVSYCRPGVSSPLARCPG
jgi:hypothetical protein